MSAGARVDSPGRRALRKLMRRRAAVFALMSSPREPSRLSAN